ncbi:MAG: rhodanese-like domain-containing protein [Kiritimatiellales bacterium]|nr:rhodanese-like domain-containing protein [Kiritimatiellales bacterium]MCF7863800.1 rhodanese-like domain-containing protein [Kiritimatiellales bacterium]
MKTVVKIGLAVVIMGILSNILFGAGADKGSDIPALIKDGALVVDVRTAEEFAGGHIAGAINIPYQLAARELASREKDLAKPIIVYCHSGARSAAAKKALNEAGFTNVVNGGGLDHMRKLLGQ